MVNALQSSSFFSSRNASSPKAIITIKKVENLTTDIIPEGEQWMFVLRIWNDDAVQALAKSKNVVTQVSRERLDQLQKQFPDARSSFETPTHEMSASLKQLPVSMPMTLIRPTREVSFIS